MKEENSGSQDSDFLKERIKQRPLNRKKLLRRTLITAIMAVLFGLIACLTFLLLEPIISNRLYPEEEVVVREFPVPDEVIEEEILPEDMIVDETQMQAENPETDSVVMDDSYIVEIVAKQLEQQRLGTEEYVSMNNAMMGIAREARKAMVTVSGVTSDVDGFNNAFDTVNQTSGTIVFDNGIEYHILVDTTAIKDAETIMVTFIDGKQYPAGIRRSNRDIGLTILSVSKHIMSEETRNQIKVIELGNSSTVNIIGTPIIAIGRIVGHEESICYGFITSTTGTLPLADASYKLITSDIYGSSSAEGIFINLRGQVVGIIDNSFNSDGIENITSVIGISELSPLIRSMCNDTEKAYLGIYGTDVPPEVHEVQGVPLGAYVRETEMDSPALSAGIQSGDVIVDIEGEEIAGFKDYVSALFKHEPEQSILMTVMRQAPEGYREIELEVVLGHSE